MNYIVLEGISLYLFLLSIILLFAVSIAALICAVLSDKRKFVVENLLLREKDKAINLVKENFILKLKCGEFDIDEE